MQILETKSISNFNLITSTILSDAKKIEDGLFHAIVYNNQYVIVQFGPAIKIIEYGYINKKIKSTAYFIFNISEYLVEKRSETSVLVKINDHKGKEFYFMCTQYKNNIISWKLIKQISGWNKMLLELLNIVVKNNY